MELVETLRGAGFPHDLPLDGQYHRFPLDGESYDGFFIGFADSMGPVYARFGDWREQRNWKIWKRGHNEPSKETIEEKIEQAKAEYLRKKEAAQEEAANHSSEFLAQAQPATHDHPYLKAKKLPEAFGARLDPANGKLLVPLRDIRGRTWSYQSIGLGGKRFRKGGKKRGCFYVIGSHDANTPRYFVAEGFATAATIHMATREPVVVAFDSGNLGPVVEALLSRVPDKEIVIAADNDCWNKDGTKKDAKLPNTGRDSANALRLKARIAHPHFNITKNKPTDFNDLYQNEGIEEVIKQLGPTDAQTIQFMSMEELLTLQFEDHDWLIEDILPRGGIAGLLAKPKVGKSTLVRQLCLAVARGTTFLGKQTQQGRVLYMAVEEIPGPVSQHFKAMGATAEDPIHTHFYGTPPEAIAELGKLCAHNPPALIVLDTLFRIMKVEGNDSNSYTNVMDAFERLQKIARSSGCAVVFVHHAKKGEGFGSEVGIGSTAIGGAVDNSIIMEKDAEGRRVLYTEPRYGVPIEKTELLFDAGRGVLSLGMPPGERRLADRERDVLGALGQEWMAVPDIQDNAGVRRDYLNKALGYLCKAGRVEMRSVENGSRGRPSKEYRLASEPGCGVSEGEMM